MGIEHINPPELMKPTGYSHMVTASGGKTSDRREFLLGNHRHRSCMFVSSSVGFDPSSIYRPLSKG